jgi:hypothetical protein
VSLAGSDQISLLKLKTFVLDRIDVRKSLSEDHDKLNGIPAEKGALLMIRAAIPCTCQIAIHNVLFSGPKSMNKVRVYSKHA